MDEKTFRQFEFCSWYKERLFTYLFRDELYLETSFCMIGIDLMLRQNEISMLTWEQIDLDNRIIKDVKISKKLSPTQEGLLSYGDLHMTDDIYFSLKHYQAECGIKTGKLFPMINRGVYYDKIQKSIGDITFNGIRLRQIGITLKLMNWKKVNDVYEGFLGALITRELLDFIKIGDMVRCNSWNRGMKVKGVSTHYFLMAKNMFGKTLYSVCDKNPTVYGTFYIGTDNLIFGHPCEYKFDDENVTKEYLDDFENGNVELSRRNKAKLEEIFIKR